MVLLARCRPQRTDQMTVINVHWSLSGEKSYTFEISPSDITTLSLTSWEKTPDRLKTAVFGRGRDRLLLDDLRSRYESLDSWLSSIGAKLTVGLTFGNAEQSSNSASNLKAENLGLLRTCNLQPFQLPRYLEPFQAEKVERSRTGNIYIAPLLLVKEMLIEEYRRPVAALADRNLIYTNSIFGAALGNKDTNRESGLLVATIMNSALVSWFILMTGSEFGLCKRRSTIADFGGILIPNPQNALKHETGQALLAMEEQFRIIGVKQPEDWEKLDQAVFDLYELD